MTQLLNFLQCQKENIIRRIYGTSHTVNGMSYRYASTKNRIIFNIIDSEMWMEKKRTTMNQTFPILLLKATT